jgi:hypothetical protein
MGEERSGRSVSRSLRPALTLRPGPATVLVLRHVRLSAAVCSTVAGTRRKAMDVDIVRERAEAFCDALDAGDVEAATGHMSPELRRNLGEVLALLPLPSEGSEIVSADRAGSGYDVVLRLVGPADEVELQTRWKDRDGQPTLVEASHLRRTERVAEGATVGEGEAATEG